MLSTALLTFLALPASAPSAAPLSPPAIQEVDHEAEIAAAGDDLEKVLELARAWKEARQSTAAKAAFKRALELDAENEEAHKGLRHHFYDGKWFESYSALSKYKREETARMKEKGLSKLGDEWVPTADLPYLKMGWVKSEAGQWVDPVHAAQAAFEEQMAAEGRQLRPEDSSWVHPDDFDKWTEGLWQVGEEWVSLEQANELHAQITSPWRARGERFDLWTTCDLETLLAARWQADLTFPDLVRIYGVQPSHRPVVIILRDIGQFNSFAAGDQASGLPASESSGFSSLHHSYFADSLFNPGAEGSPRYIGTGVGYWDSSANYGEIWGKMSARHAAGLAYAEAIAPSLLTIANAISGGAPPNLDEFWREKPVPRWLFYGAAAYVERFYVDETLENPLFQRAASVGDLLGQGDLDPLETVFAFNLSLEAIPASTRMILEAGLVVAFILDGNCGPVIEAHRAYKNALKSGEGAVEAAQALQQAVLANQEAFNQFVTSS